MKKNYISYLCADLKGKINITVSFVLSKIHFFLGKKRLYYISLNHSEDKRRNHLSPNIGKRGRNACTANKYAKMLASCRTKDKTID